MSNEVFNWEMAGILVIFILNFILHEAYDFSGNNALVALFAPVNESVWEHMKMAAFSVLFFSILESYFIGNITKNFFLAKGLSILFIPVMIAIVNIVYMRILGEHMVVIDIVSLFIWIVVGQAISYKLLTHDKSFLFLNSLFLTISIIMLILYIVFTFIPPNNDIFREPGRETINEFE